MANIGVSLAFLAGLASFLSPCVFSLVPAYIGYLGGRSAASASGGRPNRWLTLSHGLAFVLGFSVVFVLLGVATSALGGALFSVRTLLAKIGGAVVIIFGIHMTGLFRIRWLEYDLRPQTAPDRSRGYLASALMGVFFSAGWSPCVGPILGTILTLALNGGSISQGVTLLSAYSAGLAIPFLIASTQISLVTMVIRRYGKLMHYIEVIMGVLLIIVGIMLLTGRYQQIATLGSLFGTFDEVLIGRYLLLAFVVLTILGLIPAAIASRKGRNFFDWWFFGTSLLPVALPASILLKPKAREPEGGDLYPESDSEEAPAGT
jgi:cytochrome c-type biogenesis protein